MHPSWVGFPVSESANKKHKKHFPIFHPFEPPFQKNGRVLIPTTPGNFWDHGIYVRVYIYIYIPRTWWSTSFLGRLTLHFMGQILQNVGPHLGSRYIHVYIVFFQQDDGFFHVTPSSSVPGPFLSNVSHVWEAQQVKLRKQNQGMKIRKNRWASDQFNLLM